MTKIPNLNRKISIQSQSTTQDSFGQPIQSWTTIYTCWAAIDTQNSQLLYSTAEFMAKATYRITFRWQKTVVIAPNQRIVYTDGANTSHTYEIESLLNPSEGNVWITALCYELGGSV